MLVSSRMLRRLLVVGLAVACLAGCATVGEVNRKSPRGTDVNRNPATASVPASPSEVPPALEATSLVLLRLRQTLHGAPAAERKGLTLWIANVDMAELLHRVDSDTIPTGFAAEGWIAWHLSAGSYQVVIDGYANNDLRPRNIRDRYRFSVSETGRAYYLDSLTYACEPSWWFNAICPEPPVSAPDLDAAQPVAVALGLPKIATLPFERLPSMKGTDPGRIPQFQASETLLMAGEGKSVRAVQSFLDKVPPPDASAVAMGVGTQTLIQLAPFGPFAVVLTLPAMAIADIGVSIQNHAQTQRLTQRAQCLRRIWDERADALARQFLEAALQRAAGEAMGESAGRSARPLTFAEDHDRHHRIMALNVQRLAIDSCSSNNPWDSRDKLFCLKVAVRARVYGPNAASPLSDEVFVLDSDRPFDPEFYMTGWPIPPGDLYETSLAGHVEIARTYDDYCAGEGFALVEVDLRRMLEALVSQVLTLYGLLPLRTQ
jgi:hypothetical protein